MKESQVVTTNELTFDEAAHVYRLNGTPLISVTTVLKKAGIVVADFFTEEGRLRGTAVHKAVFYDIHADLHLDSLHPMIRPYVEGWLKFKRETHFRPIKALCEVRHHHPLYFYAGTPDVVGWLNGRPALIDVKTGDATTARFQTAAYREFPKILALQPDRFDLRLKPDGTYRLNRHPNHNDILQFWDALKKVRESELSLT